jgi:hypothetical protein
MTSPSLILARISQSVDSLGFHLFPLERLKSSGSAPGFFTFGKKNQLYSLLGSCQRHCDCAASTEHLVKKRCHWGVAFHFGRVVGWAWSPGALFRRCKHAAAAGLVNSLFCALGISFPAEFALGHEGASPLFAGAWFRLSEFLSFAGEARLGHAHASANGAFRATLAAVSFSFMCITFAGPFVLGHGATGAGML